MSNFSKMEQAERWYNKLMTLSEIALYDDDDLDTSEKYREEADRLMEAITNVQYRIATKSDYAIFNKAVAARSLRDAEMAIRADMNSEKRVAGI